MKNDSECKTTYNEFVEPVPNISPLKNSKLNDDALLICNMLKYTSSDVAWLNKMVQ